MQAPLDVQLHEELGLLLWKPRGVLNENGVNQILAFLGKEEALADASELRFIDTTALTAIDLNFQYVFHVALYRRLSRVGRPTIKSAFLVHDDALAHYFKLHALLTNHSSLQVRVFKECEAVAKWLNVPIKLLDIP
jgi:hypothetical protein